MPPEATTAGKPMRASRQPVWSFSLHHTNINEWAGPVLLDQSVCALRVLIITGDRTLAGQITAYLCQRQCRAVATAEMPPPGRLTAEHFNLVLIDVQLQPLNGFEVLRRVRSQSNIPVIMMSRGPHDDHDCVMGLDLGADDFVDVPCHARELLARGRAILRRHGAAGEAPANQRGGYRFGGWELRCRTRTLTDPSGQPVALSKTDYALLLAFLTAPRRPLSRLHLMRATRPHEDIFDRSIDVQVLRLRKKIQANGRPQLLSTDRNRGYVLEADVEWLF